MNIKEKQEDAKAKRHTRGQSGEIRIKRMKAILEAAEIEFSKKGFSGTSLQAIADRAGLTKWQIIYFFKTKQNLYKEVINQLYSQMGSINNYFHEGEPSEIISRYLDYIIKFIQANPHGNKLLVNEMAQGAEFAIPILQERNTKKDVDLTVRQFEQWVVEKKLKPVDPIIFIFLLWSVQHFFAVFKPEVAYLLGKEELGSDDWNRIVTELKSIFSLMFNADH